MHESPGRRVYDEKALLLSLPPAFYPSLTGADRLHPARQGLLAGQIALQLSDFGTNCPISDSFAGQTADLSVSSDQRIGTKEPAFLLFFGISPSMEHA